MEVPKVPIIPILIHYGFDEWTLKDYDHSWFKVRCEFHGEQNASASYSTDLQAFSCHACGVKGDAIKIVQQREGLDFKDALNMACEIAGVSNDGTSAANQSNGTFKVKRVSGAERAASLLGGSAKPLQRKKGGRISL